MTMRWLSGIQSKATPASPRPPSDWSTSYGSPSGHGTIQKRERDAPASGVRYVQASSFEPSGEKRNQLPLITASAKGPRLNRYASPPDAAATQRDRVTGQPSERRENTSVRPSGDSAARLAFL